MRADFTGAHAKLRRAYEHFALLCREIIAWRELKPHRFPIEGDPARYGYGWFFTCKEDHPIPAERWGLLVGDIIHCSRSALDHAAYALAEKFDCTGAFATRTKVQFPICDDYARFKGQASRLADIPARVQARIELEQPYNRRNPSPLTFGDEVVRDFDDADKHRLLHVAAVIPQDARVVPNVPLLGKPRLVVHPDPLEHDAPCATLTTTEPNYNVDVTLHFAASVCVQHPERQGAYIAITDVTFGAIRAARRIVGGLERFAY